MKKCTVCNIEKDESEYNKNKKYLESYCKLCSKIKKTCEHNRIKSNCKDCKGGSICEHNKRKSNCEDCSNRSQFCKHDKLKIRCKEYDGSAFCIHKSRKETCKLCKGGSVCSHNKIKYICIDCNGSQLCKHGKIKSACKDCKGSGVCIHDNNKYKYQCIICTPNTRYYCIECRIFIVNARTNHLCTYCNPDKPTRIKTKELNLKKFLEESQYDFEYNIRCIYQNISYFPDFKIKCKNYWIIIECDENGHNRYDKKDEKIREHNIIFALNSTCVFLRFNPDNKQFKKKVDIKHKNTVLKSYIEYYMNKDIVENTVEYLFY